MLAGQTLQNRYYLLQQVGRGAFGRTYKAQDRAYCTAPLCAVKHLQPEDSRPEVLSIAQNLFHREAEALAKLGRYSDQIPTLIDRFQEQQEFFLVEEWIEGRSLGELLPIGSRLTQVETIGLLIDILQPLVFCHQEAVIHRDLKPDNIMHRTKDGKLVLIDFGAVKEIAQNTRLGPVAPAHSVIGTAGFMPLEQFRGRPVYASDVYAVGAIGLQVLTGVAAHLIEVDDRSATLQWRDLCYVTSAFAAVLNRMVHPLASQRYPQAQDALGALLALPHRELNLLAPRNLSLPPVAVLQTPPLPATPAAQPSLLPLAFDSAQVELVSQVKCQPVTTDPGFWGRPSRQSEERRRISRTAQIMPRTQLSALGYVESINPAVSLTMVQVPAGEFWMGAPPSEEGSHDREGPQRLVQVPMFFMGQTLVTQAQWQALMGKNPAIFRGSGSLPVEHVGYLEAQSFCERLSHQTGRKYRLPSEAEWEYACRAGSQTPFYYGEVLTTALANFDGKQVYGRGPSGQLRYRTTPVGSFPANGFGLYDLHGNLWEWCADSWHDNYQGAPNDGTAWMGKSHSHVLRGGAWLFGPRSCRSACRVKADVYAKVNYIGFRVVYSPSPQLI